MNKHDFKEAVLILLVSTLIGAAVGYPFYFLTENVFSLPLYLLFSGAAGFSIGFIARFLFGVVFIRLNSRPAFAFITTAGVIGIGTFVWSWLLTQEFTFFSLIVILCAEIIGLAATFFFFRYTRKLNRHLKETQRNWSES